MPNFDHIHPKIIEITFSFPEFAPACKKSVHSINSFLRYRQIQSPVTRLATPILTLPTPKFFGQPLIYVNLCEHKKIRQFHWFALEIWLIKKSCNVIVREHFGPYLRNKNFPKYEICAGTQQIIYIFILDQFQ